MDGSLGCEVVTHSRFRIPRVKIPTQVIDTCLVNGHSKVLTNMLGPGGNNIFQSELAWLLQAFIQAAVESAVAPKGCLHLLHQAAKLQPVLLRLREFLQLRGRQ